MPDRGSIHTSMPLSQLSVGYNVIKHIWNQVLPVCPVDQETGKYKIYGDDFLRYYGVTRADKTESKRVDSYSATEDTYACSEHSYHDIVTDRERNAADPGVDPEQRVTRNLTRIVDLDVEVSVANLVQTTGSYASGHSETVATKWNNDVANCDPTTDVDRGKAVIAAAIGTDPNVFVMGKQVFDQLKRNPDIIAAFKGVMKGIITAEMLAEYFGVSKVIVGEGTYINSKKGQTKTRSYIWGKNAALLYVTDQAAIEEPSFGYSFFHKLFGSLTAMVDRIPAPTKGKGGVQIEVTRSFVPKITASTAGYYFNAAIN